MSLITGTWTRDRFAFGGALLKGSHAKTKRSFNRKLPLHVIMKSSQARGTQSLLRHSSRIARILGEQAVRHHVRLMNTANAGNHIHLLLQAPSRAHLSAFLRAISGRIAQVLGGVERLRGGRYSRHSKSSRHTQPFRNTESTSPDENRFWDARPFSRIVSWGRDLRNVARYLTLNSTESVGLSRRSVRAIFQEVQQALLRGIIPRTPSLQAAGFV